MGSGGSKSHQAFTVATASTDDPSTATSNVAVLDHPETTSAVDKGALVAEATVAGLVHSDQLSAKALSTWLDNDTDPAIKEAIEAKAAERYHDTTDATITPTGVIDAVDDQDVPDGMWTATPAEVIAAQTAFTDALAGYKPHGYPLSTDSLEALIDAENHLATAHCPELADPLAAAVESARVAVDNVAIPPATGWQLAHQAIDAGELDAQVANTLNVDQALQLMRSSTPVETRTQLTELIATRTGELNDLAVAKAGIQSHLDNGTVAIAGVDNISEFTSSTADYYASVETVNGWGWQRMEGSGPHDEFGTDHLAAQFRSWAKSQSLTELRQTSVDMGLGSAEAKSATRAQIQNWMIGAWHPAHDQKTIASAMLPAAPAASPVAPTPVPAPAPVQPAGSAGQATKSSASSPTAGSGIWHRKHAQLVAAIKHHTASITDAPQRPDAQAVQSWTFTDGPAMSLGGAHTKSVHTAPDGSTWMFKPDNSGGAKAVSESAANKILNRVGIPTCPVYTVKLNGKTGTVQPLMKGATSLAASPSEWSQADVDSIVRYHAAAWVIGDHDAKYDNVLRTPSGGLVPIDHGQAFKFYGRDKLSTDFHPNKAYGSAPAVWNAAYLASKAGKLAPGVKIRPEAALPVIKAFESLNDAEFASILHPAAHQGATNSKIHWRDAMAKGPKGSAVADNFIAHATGRKNTLRASFVAFFKTEGIPGGDTLDKVR